MGLFGSRKKSEAPIRTLSEKEIQSRLYGHLREPGPVQEDLPQLSKPKQQEAFQKSSSASIKTLTPSAAPAHQKPSITSPELFGETEAPETETPRHYSEPVRKPSITGKADFSSNPVHQGKKPASFSGAAVHKNAGKALQASGDFAKTAGLKFAGILAWTLTSVVRLFSSIDFKKPAVRRALYTCLGVGALALIFFGVHLLNAQREEAMKNPPKQPLTPRVVKAAPVAETAAAVNAPVNEKKTEAKAAKTAAQKKAETPKKTETSTPAQTETPAAVVSVQTPAETPAKPAVPAAAEKIEGPAYVIQVATFADQMDAQKLAERFKADSLNAFIKPLSRSGGRVYYCVFIGKFKTNQDAETALTGFKKKTIAQPFQDAFIRLMQ